MARLFTVLERPKAPDVVVPSGFSWACFFLGPFWALATRTWSVFWTYVFVNLGALWVSISLVGDWVGVLSFIGLGVNLFVSSNANDWRRSGLIDHGYKVRAEMAGPTKAFVLAELARHARDNG